jgi:hypothetical protein
MYSIFLKSDPSASLARATSSRESAKLAARPPIFFASGFPYMHLLELLCRAMFFHNVADLIAAMRGPDCIECHRRPCQLCPKKERQVSVLLLLLLLLLLLADSNVHGIAQKHYCTGRSDKIQRTANSRVRNVLILVVYLWFGSEFPLDLSNPAHEDLLLVLQHILVMSCETDRVKDHACAQVGHLQFNMAAALYGENAGHTTFQALLKPSGTRSARMCTVVFEVPLETHHTFGATAHWYAYFEGDLIRVVDLDSDIMLDQMLRELEPISDAVDALCQTVATTTTTSTTAMSTSLALGDSSGIPFCNCYGYCDTIHNDGPNDDDQASATTASTSLMSTCGSTSTSLTLDHLSRFYVANESTTLDEYDDADNDDDYAAAAADDDDGDDDDVDDDDDDDDDGRLQQQQSWRYHKW